jgi:hypothetical protein
MKKMFGIASGKAAHWLSQVQADFESLESEWAVAAVLGGKPDYRHYPGPDDGHDLMVNGTSIQVKLNHYEDGDLYVNYDENMNSDIAVLVTPAGDHLFALKGWTTGTDFESLHEVRDYGYGKRKALPQTKLHPMRRLICISEQPS